MTFEEFFEWLDDDTRAEWVNGKVELMPPESERHNDIVIFLIRVLADYAEAHDLGKIMGPFLMRLNDVPSARIPDTMFVRTERLTRFADWYLDGPADLAIEVISPSSVTRDRRTKLHEYETAGVGEYWLIDPLRQRADFYLLEKDRRCRHVSVDDHGVFRSPTLDGLALPVAWLWKEPLPKVSDVRRELGLP